jgi:hypothetical protein
MKKKVKSKFALECLDCGEPYFGKSDLDHCPLCNGPGEISTTNFEDSGWGNDNDFFKEDPNDFSDIDNLVFDPDIYND